MRVVLVGFMAAGKSTVGPLLGRRLGCRFVDLDEEVARRAGRSVPEIFAAEGEEGFRRREAEATAGLDGGGDLVVAVGGGWMARPELRDRWPDAIRIWLQVTPEEAVRRIGGRLSGRPMLDPERPEESARSLLERRRGLYARAELAVGTVGKSPDEVAGEIVRRLAGEARPRADEPAGEGRRPG